MKHIIETNRLYFREFTEADAPLVYQLNSDPEVMRYLHEPETTMANAVDAIRSIILPQYALYHHGRWALYVKDSNTFIGWCGLKYLKEREEIDLGYRLMKTAWGKGYATEAAKATIEYGFNTLNMPRLVARAHIENTASLQVIEKCGFHFIRQDVFDGCPVKTYELLNPTLDITV